MRARVSHAFRVPLRCQPLAFPLMLPRVGRSTQGRRLDLKSDRHHPGERVNRGRCSLAGGLLRSIGLIAFARERVFKNEERVRTFDIPGGKKLRKRRSQLRNTLRIYSL